MRKKVCIICIKLRSRVNRICVVDFCTNTTMSSQSAIDRERNRSTPRKTWRNTDRSSGWVKGNYIVIEPGAIIYHTTRLLAASASHVALLYGWSRLVRYTPIHDHDLFIIITNSSTLFALSWLVLHSARHGLMMMMTIWLFCERVGRQRSRTIWTPQASHDK